MLAGENLKLTGLGWRPECTLERGLQRMLSDMAPRTSDHRGAVDGD